MLITYSSLDLYVVILTLNHYYAECSRNQCKISFSFRFLRYLTP
ncbi:hypothetical protein EDO6_03869 [Paenibacillus xylanexedens]|nr:hypothetical protein EDO6_03869 [Paenibacillus xylanexedens]